MSKRIEKRKDVIIREDETGKLMTLFDDKYQMVNEVFVPTEKGKAENININSFRLNGKAGGDGVPVQSTGRNLFANMTDIQKEIPTEKPKQLYCRDAKGRFCKKEPSKITIGMLADVNRDKMINSGELVEKEYEWHWGGAYGGVSQDVYNGLSKVAFAQEPTKPTLWQQFKLVIKNIWSYVYDPNK